MTLAADPTSAPSLPSVPRLRLPNLGGLLRTVLSSEYLAIFLAILALVVVVALAIVAFGYPALIITGLAGTATMFGVLVFISRV